MKAQLAFVAIGGNSLIKSNALQRVEDQHDAIRETVAHVVDLIDHGYQVIISHGNGPRSASLCADRKLPAGQSVSTWCPWSTPWRTPRAR